MTRSPHQGVYRFRHQIDGRNAWYAIDETGVIADFRISNDEGTPRDRVNHRRRAASQTAPPPPFRCFPRLRLFRASLSAPRRKPGRGELAPFARSTAAAVDAVLIGKPSRS
jgi:hypothetical protein